MIRTIAAIDQKMGVATDKGIPWDLPDDKKYFRDKTAGSLIVMGYRVYQEREQPFPDRQNYVVIRPGTSLRNGFLAIIDIKDFIKSHQNDNVWIIGGAAIYQLTINDVSELYITQIEADFKCTKFFPDFHDSFNLDYKSEPQQQNNLNFYFEIWKRNN